jgi:multiple sugar transport system ATP-binding protein
LAGKYREDRRFPTFSDSFCLKTVSRIGLLESTTLRMVAGLEDITSGEIYLGDQLVKNLPPKDRDMNYALYPHMTVYDNMAFGLKMRKFPKADIEKRVREAATLLAGRSRGHGSITGVDHAARGRR